MAFLATWIKRAKQRRDRFRKVTQSLVLVALCKHFRVPRDVSNIIADELVKMRLAPTITGLGHSDDDPEEEEEDNSD